MPARDRETLELLLREVNAMRQSAFTERFRNMVGGCRDLVRQERLNALAEVEEHILARIEDSTAEAWQAPPSEATWYGEVIYEGLDGQTDYAYGYSALDDAPDPVLLLPTGALLLEKQVKRCPR